MSQFQEHFFFGGFFFLIKNTSTSQPALWHGYRTLGSFCLDQLSYSKNTENWGKEVAKCACDAAQFFC